MTGKTYRSRIDTWLIVVTASAVVAMLLTTIVTYPRSSGAAWVNLGVLALMVLIAVLFAYPCEYTLSETHLVVRSGLIRQRIAYRDITAVEKSSSLWSAPALSLQRVKVSYAGRFQLVSPLERDKFVAELSSRVSAATARS